jgi:hypothetical protein
MYYDLRIAVVLFVAGLACLAQAQVPMTGGGKGAPGGGGGGGSAWHDVYTQTLPNDESGWGTYTIVTKIPSTAISHGGSKVRLTLQSNTTDDSDIANMYIGHAAASGDAFDFETTPVQVLFSSNATAVVTRSGSDIVSDEAVFALDNSKNLLVAFYVTAGALSKAVMPADANNNAWYLGGDTSSTVDKSASFNDYGNTAFLIKKVEAFY